MTDRYDKVPISDQTKRGMSLNIDDLGAIGRMLSLQDLVYDEQFEKIAKLIDKQSAIMLQVLTELGEVKSDIKDIKKEIVELRSDQNHLREDVGDLADRVGVVEKEVELIKKTLKKKGVL
jgi:archaellum component FlaC